MSVWQKMDNPTKILLGAGLLLMLWGYIGVLMLQKFPSPTENMSIGLGFIGIALAYVTIMKS
jgi:hypothetical protein